MAGGSEGMQMVHTYIRYIGLEAIKRQVLHHNIIVLGTVRQKTNCEVVTPAIVLF